MSDPNRASYDPTPKEHITSISRQPRDCFTETEHCEHQPEPLRTEMKTSQPGIMSISWDRSQISNRDRGITSISWVDCVPSGSKNPASLASAGLVGSDLTPHRQHQLDQLRRI